MTAEKIPERKDIPLKNQWDLSPLFKSDEEWESLFAKTEKEIEQYKDFQGRLHESAGSLLSAIEFDLGIGRAMDRIYTYAHLKTDEDKANQRYNGLHQRAVTLYTRVSELASFIVPEIQSIPEQTMAGFMADSKLAPYRFYLEKIIRFKPHTLSRELEEMLAMTGEIAQAPSQIFGMLDNADLKFAVIKDDKGRDVELSHGNFISFLMSQSRVVRKTAFFEYYRAYDEHKNSMAAALALSNRKDRFYSRVRKFESCREASLFDDNVPGIMYDSLIGAVKKNISPLVKYLNFRKKALGLDGLRIYDTYAPLVPDIDFSMGYEEAVDVCCGALSPLGTEYVDILRKGLLGGWVDRYENRGKRSGAYSSGCYDSPPYILMNYKDDTINSLYTLIHEAGHSMHSYYSIKNQPYLYHGYTIFVAEVASTLNETLLTRHLTRKYENNRAMRAYIINREIDNIRGTLFRQTMFAEFEKITHGIIEKNDPLTLDTLRDIYRNLLKEYFGDTIVIDEELTLECLRIPHFYSAFYVYKYATGISAAIYLADKILNEGASAQDRYLKFLTLGGSAFPLDELAQAGVDMRSGEAVAGAIRHFGELVDELAEIL